MVTQAKAISIPRLLRREALGVALSFAAGTLSRGPANDALLLRQCAQFQDRHAALCGLMDAGAEDEEFGAVHDEWHAALDALIPARAVTVAGIRAKAACLLPALRCLLGDPDEEIEQQQELRLALSIADDLARLEG